MKKLIFPVLIFFLAFVCIIGAGISAMKKSYPPITSTVAQSSSTAQAPIDTVVPIPQVTLSTISVSTISPVTSHLLTCKVTASALNVRACANLSCAAVDWLFSGDVVTLTHTTQPDGAWLEIDTGDLTGFVKSEFCEVKPCSKK